MWSIFEPTVVKYIVLQSFSDQGLLEGELNLIFEKAKSLSRGQFSGEITTALQVAADKYASLRSTASASKAVIVLCLVISSIAYAYNKLSKNKINFLDALSSLIFGLTALFFSFRMVLGARDMFVYQEETMLLAFPIWIPFLPVIASFFLLTICCFYTFIIKVFNIEGN